MVSVDPELMEVRSSTIETSLENLEKYDRKTNILAPNKNEMEVVVQVYLPKEPRTPELCSRPESLFFYKSAERNTTIRNFM